MENVEITSVSSRGQVVIPQALRDRMKIQAGEKFVVIGENDTIVSKKLEMPSFKGVNKLLTKTRNFAKKNGIKASDVEEAIKKTPRTFRY